MATEKAMLGAGCFWGVEAAFCGINGVVSTAVGYSGGTTANPIYEDVCTGRTGHAEVVLVEFDPERISYDELMDVFWKIHDPTALNRQGADVGAQYRSAIFYFSAEQERAARASKDRHEARANYRLPVVTEITPAGEFYRAEEYHQRYFEKQGRMSCG